MIHIRAIAQRQINLDRCAGGAIHLVRHLLEDLRASHQRVETARHAALPLLATPSGQLALGIFQKLVTIEAVIQKTIRVAWIEREVRWNEFPGLGCGLRDRPERNPFPRFPAKLVTPSTSIFDLGSSQFLSSLPRQITLGASIAKLSTEAVLKLENQHGWSVRWSK